MACTGSGIYVGFSPAHIVALNDATGRPARARVRCPVCARVVVGRCRLDGSAIVPNHKAA